MNDLAIKEIRDKLGLSQTDFAKKIGVSLRTVQNYEAGGVIPESKYEILRTINSVDTLPMITNLGDGVPYYDVDFIGGFDLVLNDQTSKPRYHINFSEYNSADCWVNVTGRSMEPEVSHGDIIAIKEVKDWNTHILFGEMYALVTEENRTIKYIRSSSKGDKWLRLVPVNKVDYDEQDIPKETILKVFKVLGSTKRFQ